MQPDVAMIEDGGKSDLHYGRDWQVMGQPPVKVDRVLRDGDTGRLGVGRLIAHHTPGHTRGATTWDTTLVDNGRRTPSSGLMAAASTRATASPRSLRHTPASTPTTAERTIFTRSCAQT